MFLTHGQIQTRAGASQVSRALRTSNGIPEDWDVPHSAEFAFLLGRRLLAKSMKWINIRHGLMVEHRTVCYYGLLCEPKTSAELGTKRRRISLTKILATY